MTQIINLTNLTKNYGKSRGITDITLSVNEGEIFGFLGPNGAGKSTTINMLVNLTAPTSGKIEIFGKDSLKHGKAIRKEIGYLASDMALDGHLTGYQQLEYFGHLRKELDKDYINKLAKRLDCNLNRKIKTLSRGNRQKVGLITALAHKPKLLILDEPTSGLDPLIQAEFNKIILEHKESGGTTFISSHVLSEVQELCDHVAFIRQGKLISSLSIDEIAKSLPKQVSLKSSDKKLLISIKKLSGISNLEAKPHLLKFNYSGDSNKLLATLSKHNISDISIEDTDLEQSFMAYYEDKDA